MPALEDRARTLAQCLSVVTGLPPDRFSVHVSQRITDDRWFFTCDGAPGAIVADPGLDTERWRDLATEIADQLGLLPVEDDSVLQPVHDSAEVS